MALQQLQEAIDAYSTRLTAQINDVESENLEIITRLISEARKSSLEVPRCCVSRKTLDFLSHSFVIYEATSMVPLVYTDRSGQKHTTSQVLLLSLKKL